MERGELRRADASVAVTQFLDLCAGELHRKRLFGVVGADDPDAVEKQARNAVATFRRPTASTNEPRRARLSGAASLPLSRSWRKIVVLTSPVSSASNSRASVGWSASTATRRQPVGGALRK